MQKQLSTSAIFWGILEDRETIAIFLAFIFRIYFIFNRYITIVAITFIQGDRTG